MFGILWVSEGSMSGLVSEVQFVSLAERAIIVSSTVPEVVDHRANEGWRDADDKVESVC